MKIAAVYMERAMTWPMMRVDDINALQSFSIFLRDCCNVMEDLQHIEEMNVPFNLRLIMMKLSYKLRENGGLSPGSYRSAVVTELCSQSSWPSLSAR